MAFTQPVSTETVSSQRAVNRPFLQKQYPQYANDLPMTSHQFPFMILIFPLTSIKSGITIQHAVDGQGNSACFIGTGWEI